MCRYIYIYIYIYLYMYILMTYNVPLKYYQYCIVSIYIFNNEFNIFSSVYWIFIFVHLGIHYCSYLCPSFLWNCFSYLYRNALYTLNSSFSFVLYKLDAWDKCSDLVLWEDLEGAGGEGGGRGDRDGEDM